MFGQDNFSEMGKEDQKSSDIQLTCLLSVASLDGHLNDRPALAKMFQYMKNLIKIFVDSDACSNMSV